MPENGGKPSDDSHEVILYKLDGIAKRLDEISDAIKCIEKAQNEDSKDIMVLKTKVEAHSADIEKIEGKSDLWNIGNSIGVIVAGIIALFRGGQQ